MWPQKIADTVTLSGFPGGSAIKNPPTKTGDLRDSSSILRLERSPGKGNSNPFQYSCLGIPWTEEPGGLQPTGVTKSKQLTSQGPKQCPLWLNFLVSSCVHCRYLISPPIDFDSVCHFCWCAPCLVSHMDFSQFSELIGTVVNISLWCPFLL